MVDDKTKFSIRHLVQQSTDSYLLFKTINLQLHRIFTDHTSNFPIWIKIALDVDQRTILVCI